MRRVVLIFAAVVNFIPARAEWANRFDPVLLIQGEYRRDTIDYDETEREFYREKVGLTFSRLSSVSLAHVCIGKEREHRFTWNIAATDISPYFKCMLGNFHVNFGTGLMVGKKRGISPDLFSRRFIISRGEPYMPCTSGNPLYSFRGAAATGVYAFAEMTLSVGAFFSFKNRFADSGIYQDDRTNISFNTIASRTAKDYRHAEPVQINDYGCSVDCKAGEHISIQCYFIYTNIRRDSHDIVWNYDSRGFLSYGDKAFYGYGLYAHYRDDYILIFCELGMPGRIVEYEWKKRKTIGDFGVAYGFSFRHPAFRLSLTGKNTGKQFYSPYSSGHGYAENAWSAELSVIPFPKLSLSAGFFSEKKISPSYNETYLPHNRREQVSIAYRLPHKGVVRMQFYCLRKEKQYGHEQYLQLRASVRYFINGSILLSLSGKAQKRNRKNYSTSAEAGLGFTIWNFATIALHYSRFFISGENYLYSAMSPCQGSITPGRFIKSSSNVAVGTITVRYKETALSARYEHQFTRSGTIQHRIEFFGKCLL
jgi:hypothetical protein